MLRVLHVIRPSVGGMLRSVELLTSHLGEHDIKADIADKDLIPARPSFGQDRKAAHQLRIIAKDYDLIHAHGYRGAWVAGWELNSKKPWIWTAHNLYSIPSGSIARLFINTIFHRLERSSRACIAVSKAVALSLEKSGIEKTKINEIYGGIDLSAFENETKKTEARQSLGIAEIAPTIAAVGRFAPEKGFDIMLQAMEILWDTVPDAIALFAGDGPMREELMKQACKLSKPDQLRFLGFINPPDDVYAASDVVCVPSRAEGLGMTAIEAMASSRPVVAFNVGGLSEVISNERTGLIVEPNNPDALAQSLALLLKDRSKAMTLALAGRQYASQQFDIRRTASETASLYQKVVTSA
jgi:glycosyltransferase involved in cell wall biosynthesis